MLWACIVALTITGAFSEAFNEADGWGKFQMEDCREEIFESAMKDTFKETLDDAKCPLEYLQCAETYKNPFVNNGLFKIESTENDATFVLEIICYKAPAVESFGTTNFSYLEFVADTKLKEVTSAQATTITFAKNLAEMKDGSFIKYKNSGTLVFAGVSLVFAALASKFAL